MRRRALAAAAALALTSGAGAAVAEPYPWRLPPGFPEPPVPPENPMSEPKVELGRLLFYDTRLSGNGTLACGGCHRPELAFTDGRTRALGATGEEHPRSAMSLANVAYNTAFAWADPTLESLEEQALVPMLAVHPVEMGVRGREQEILERLRWDGRYPRLFAASFPSTAESVSLENVARAIAAFERTLISGRSAYDRLVWDDDASDFPAAARRGMRLFFSERLACGQCHGGLAFAGIGPSFHNTGLYNLRGDGSYPTPNRGLFEHTGEAADMGRFRVPTLRNIAVTAPYMHDGSITTLEEVVDHYAAGGRTLESGPHAGVGRESPYKSEEIRGFRLGPAEKDDLIAFLHSLTDEAFLGDPRFSNPWAPQTPAGAVE